MGESCRHQSPASVSLTLPEEPPDSQASLQEPATALPPLPNGKIKGCPHSLYRGRAQGAEAQRRAARARFFRAAGTQGEPGLRGGLQPSPAPRHEGGAAGSEPRAPHRRWEPPQPPLPPVQPRAGPRTGDPAPRPPRAARAASWAAGAGEPGMGAGAARPSPPPPPPPPLQTRAPPHAPLGPGRWRTVPLPGPGADKKKKKKGQNPDRLVLTVKPWGARALPLLHASAAAAGSRSALGLHREPLGSAGLLRGGSGAGQWLGRRAAGNATGGAHRSPEPPRCARRASEQRREPPRPCAAPPPRATLHNRARGPAPAAGGAAGRSPPRLTASPRSCGRRAPGLRTSDGHFPPLEPGTAWGGAAGRCSRRSRTRPWARGRSFPLSWGSVVLPNPHFGGGGRRERCWAREWGKMRSNWMNHPFGGGVEGRPPSLHPGSASSPQTTFPMVHSRSSRRAARREWRTSRLQR